MSPVYYGIVCHIRKNAHYHGHIRRYSIYDTRIAQYSQNQACLHGTSANKALGATMHTPQQSPIADSDAPEVVVAGTSA